MAALAGGAVAAAVSACGGAHDGGANLEPDPQQGQARPAPAPEPSRGNGG